MSEPKLKAKLFVHAAIKRCSLISMPIVVARKGDEDAGTILIKVYQGMGGYEVYAQARNGEGKLGWIRSTGPQLVREADADAYIRRAQDIDWDIWVLEVEAMGAPVPFLEPIFNI